MFVRYLTYHELKRASLAMFPPAMQGLKPPWKRWKSMEKHGSSWDSAEGSHPGQEMFVWGAVQATRTGRCGWLVICKGLTVSNATSRATLWEMDVSTWKDGSSTLKVANWVDTSFGAFWCFHPKWCNDLIWPGVWSMGRTIIVIAKKTSQVLPGLNKCWKGELRWCRFCGWLRVYGP